MKPSRQDLRTAAIWRLLRAGCIDRATAKTLALRPMRQGRPADLSRTIEQWSFGR